MGDRERWRFGGRLMDWDDRPWLVWMPSDDLADRGYTPFWIDPDTFWSRGRKGKSRYA